MLRCFLFVLILCTIVGIEGFSQEKPVFITVDFSKQKGPMNPLWAWFGYDEPNYTYMKDGRKLLTEISSLSPVPVFVRTHNLMTSGDGVPALKWGSTNMYTEDAQGNPVYNWAVVDSIFDTYVGRGMKPLAQIGFMPEALSVTPQPYQHVWKPGVLYRNIATGWAYPPKDYAKWGELVYQWVRHCVGRYGKSEVESWYWELWNEPDGAYWKGTWPEYFKLYDYTADAVKRGLPTARIGGCNVTGGGMKFLNAFLKHCIHGTNYVTGKTGSPLDIVLFHAKGSPKIVDGKIVMDMRSQLRNIINNFDVIGRYSQLKNIPVILGESDPEGCAACGVSTNPENAYRNGTMFSSYTAASFARKYELADRYNRDLIGAVTWSFEFEDQPWFAGFRDLATNGVDKPVLNVFRMFGKMSGTRVALECNRMYPLDSIINAGVRKDSDIGGLAAIDGNKASVLIWNYHDADKVGQSELIQIKLTALPFSGKAILTKYLIDKDHSNSYNLWLQMGSPQTPSPGQVAELEKAGQLAVVGKPQEIIVRNGQTIIDIHLALQGTVLLALARDR